MLRLRRYDFQYRLKIVVFLQQGEFDPKFQVHGVAPNHSSCHKVRMNDLLCGIRMWAHVSFVLSQITRFTDGRTDGQTDSVLRAIPCVALHAKKSYRGNKRVLIA